MPILTELSVSDVADLRSEAGNFQNHANELHKLTNQMFQLVDSTNSVWRGEAQTTYRNQFDGLQDDMEKLYQQVQEYCDDLIEIAQNYETAESTNTATGRQLTSSVNLV